MRFFYTILCILLATTPFSDQSDVNGIAGGTVALKCPEFRDNILGGVAYSWKFQEYVPESYRHHAVRDILTIRRLEPGDAGVYVCYAVQLRTQEITALEPIKLNVHWISKETRVALREPSEENEIAKGSNISLECIIDGFTTPKIDWLKNDERVLNSTKRIMKGNLLVVNDVSPLDNGVYRCVGANLAGTVQSLDNFSLKLPGKGWSTIHIVPADQIVKRGSAARVDCTYKHADVVEWYFKEDALIENSTKYSILGNNSLIINSFEASDEGLYSCVGIQQESTEVPQKYTAILYLAHLSPMNFSSIEPRIDSPPYVVSEFSSLICVPPTGRPEPRIYWKDSEGKIIPEKGKWYKSEGNKLVIVQGERVEDRVTGNYSCVAENIAGEVSVTFEIIFARSPTIVSHPKNVTVSEGDVATLSCAYRGMKSPFTRIAWIKGYLEPDNADIEDSIRKLLVDQRYVQLNEQERGTAVVTLRINDISMEQAGYYSCVVNTSTVRPILSNPAYIRVKEMLKFSPRPDGKKMEKGKPNKISCKAQGLDPPSIKWIKLDGDKIFSSHVQETNGTLYFKEVQQSDEGLYMCIASNSQGTVNVTVPIDVIVVPKFTKVSSEPVEAYEGYSALLECEAIGDPKPIIQWDSKMVDISEQRFRHLPNGSLFIEETRLSDEGFYGCTAGNSGGFNRTKVYLAVKTYQPEDAVDVAPDNTTLWKTAFVILVVAVTYITLVVGLMAYCKRRRRKRKQANREAFGESLPPEEVASKAPSNVLEMKNAVNRMKNGEGLQRKSDGETTAHSHSSNQSKKSKCSYDAFQYPRKNLKEMMLLGNGEFGSVYLSQIKECGDGGRRDSEGVVVMVKALEEVRDEAPLVEFKRQLDILTKVDHENIAKLIGLCREMTPHFMILEYTDWGDLKQFLLASRKSAVARNITAKERPSPLSLSECLKITHQVCCALQHLSDKRFVHRDVAARNVLIGSNYNVKLSFSSLSKDLYAVEYYEIRNQLMPIRWCPLEVIEEDDYSAKSDVYSFACLAWEIFHKGELPFSKMSNAEVKSAALSRKLRLKPHKAMPMQLVALLDKCWSQSPNDRPTFADVQIRLERMMRLVN